MCGGTVSPWQRETYRLQSSVRFNKRFAVGAERYPTHKLPKSAKGGVNNTQVNQLVE